MKARRFRAPPAKFLIAGFLILAATAYLAWSATRAAAVYYLTLDELLSEPASAAGKAVRVQGTVEDGTIEQDESRLWIRFRLTDGRLSAPVVYNSTPPDLLGYSTEDRYQEVIVEGTLDSDGVLQARNLLVKHGPEFKAVEKLKS